MKIEILGMGCPKCETLAENAKAAVKELNIQAEISKSKSHCKFSIYHLALQIDLFNKC